MKVLITGASGFIGKHLCRLIDTSEHEIVSFGRTKVQGTRVRHQPGSIEDATSFRSFLNEYQPQVVVHLAASSDRSRGADILPKLISANLMPMVTILEYASVCHIRPKVIHIGTAEEYGSQAAPFVETLPLKPISPYGWTKTTVSSLLEMAWNLWQVPSINLRTSIAYGPGQSETMLIPYLIGSLLRKTVPQMTTGEQIRDFVFVDDVVAAVFKAIASNSEGSKTYNIASGEASTIRDVGALIAQLVNNGIKPAFGAIPYRAGEIMDYRCNPSRAKAELGWTPQIDLKTGLRRTIDASMSTR